MTPDKPLPGWDSKHGFCPTPSRTTVACETCGSRVFLPELESHSEVCRLGGHVGDTAAAFAADNARAARATNAASAAARREHRASEPEPMGAELRAISVAAESAEQSAPRDMGRLRAIAAAAEKREADLSKQKKDRQEAERAGIELPCGPGGTVTKCTFRPETLALLFKIGKKISEHPHEAKFRNVKTIGTKFKQLVWAHVHARELLSMTGWVTLEDDRIVLPSDCSTELMLKLIREHPYVDADEERKTKIERERKAMIAQVKRDKQEDAERRRLVNLRIQADRDRHTRGKFDAMLRGGPGKQTELMSMLAEHPELLTTMDGGRPPLLIAAGAGNNEACEVLLGIECSVDERSLAGDTALHAAAAEGHIDTIGLLLEHRASLDAQDRSRSTPLALAACNGQADAVRLLLANGAACTTEDKCGRTPFFRAVLHGDAETALVLLSAGAAIEGTDVEGRTPLIAAAAACNDHVVGLLLEHGAALEASDAKDRTSLSRAASSNGVSTVRMLLSAGAVVDAPDVHGCSPAWHACTKDCGGCLEVLIEYGCNLLLADIRFNQNPIDEAFEHGAVECITVLQEVPGLDLPELPAEMLEHGGGTDGAIQARRGAELVPSSLAELQRMVDEGTTIYPRRITATFDGEEAYGDGPTRQWVSQLGRELLQHCDSQIDRPSTFSVTVVVSPEDGRPRYRFSLFGAEGDEGSSKYELTLQRQRLYTFYFRQIDYDNHPLKFTTDLDGAAEVRADRAIVAVTRREDRAAVVVTVEFAEAAPNKLYLRSGAGAVTLLAFAPATAKIVTGHHCEQHGECRPERCQLVESSDLFHTEEGVPHHLISLSPASDPTDSIASAMFLRGLGRALGIALCTGCPLGVTLSSSFCKLLRGELEDIEWRDLSAILPTTQFTLLEQCLDPAIDRATKTACIELWADATGHSTFVTDSVEKLRAGPENMEDSFEGDPARVISTVVADGGERQLTVDTMADYADALARKRLFANVSEHIRMVKLGLRDVRGAVPKLRGLPNWQSLQRAYMGSLKIDIDEWRSMVDVAPRSGAGKSDSRFSATQSFFWSEVRRMNLTDQRKLLFFWTAEAPPAGGLRHLDRRLALKVELNPAEDNRQPRSATCFCSLEIPGCSTAEQMKEVLAVCVAHWNTWGQE